MLSARLGSDKYQFYSHWFDSARIRKCEVQIRTRDLWIPQSRRMGGIRTTHSATPTGRVRIGALPRPDLRLELT